MSKKGFPGKNLSNTATCSSKGSYGPPVNQSRPGHVPERAITTHPKGLKTVIGKGLSSTQTANHPPTKR